jgi:hypothetical protein
MVVRNWWPPLGKGSSRTRLRSTEAFSELDQRDRFSASMSSRLHTSTATQKKKSFASVRDLSTVKVPERSVPVATWRTNPAWPPRALRRYSPTSVSRSA